MHRSSHSLLFGSYQVPVCMHVLLHFEHLMPSCNLLWLLFIFPLFSSCATCYLYLVNVHLHVNVQKYSI